MAAAEKPASPAAPSGLPQITLAIEAGNSTDTDIAQDLARIVGRDAGAEVTIRADSPQWRGDDQPGLAIVRYETLDAASRARARGAATYERLRVVTPLFTEEIYVLVRRDAPLTFLHEVRDTRINVGPERSSRGLTASRLYERMFGAAMPQANATALSDHEAIIRLVKDRSLDAMMIVAGQPARWLADLPPELAQRVKLLRLDRSHAIGQRAIEAYLPATVRAANYGRLITEDVPSLATMSFLVTSEYTDAAAAERLELFLRSFCRNMDRLRLQGHPKWREVQLGLDLETGWPYSGIAKKAFKDCARP